VGDEGGEQGRHRPEDVEGGGEGVPGGVGDLCGVLAASDPHCVRQQPE